MFIQLTNAEGGGYLVVFFGSGGVIKAERFEDNTTELYNSEGNCVAKVKEDLNELTMKGLR